MKGRMTRRLVDGMGCMYGGLMSGICEESSFSLRLMLQALW